MSNSYSVSALRLSINSLTFDYSENFALKIVDGKPGGPDSTFEVVVDFLLNVFN